MTEDAAPEVQAEAPREESVGESLARARAAMGLTIDDCAQQLKFAPRKIEALEQGRFDELPGGTFARGMLRSYARLLNLDADKLVGRLGAQMQVQDTTDTAVSLRRPIPFSEAGKRGNLLYVALSALALIIVAWVAYGWLQERSGAARLTFVPAAQPPTAMIGGTVTATLTPPTAPIPQEAEAEKPSGPSEPSARAPGTRRIVISFERDAWVEVRGAGGKTLLSQINPAGTQRVIEGEPPFALVVGNAQHVRVTYDEKPVELAPHVKVDVARLTLD